MKQIPVRLGLQQRVMPEYRVPFFEALGGVCQGGLSVFAGSPRDAETIATLNNLTTVKFTKARNLHLLHGSFYTCVQTNFLAWLEEWNPEALIVEANPRYLITPQAIQWMHSRKRPVVGWGLGAPKSKGFQEALRNRFLHSLDAIISYSKTGAEQYIAAGFEPKQVFVAPNAVSAKTNQIPINRSATYQDGKPVALFVGRLQERKRVDLLIQACADLSKDLQPRLIIIGDGPDHSRLQQMAARLYPSAEFCGAKHGEELEPYYAAADLFVLPGTGGLAIHQAMAHSLPVIVGEADGTQAELVRPENGWLIRNMSVNTLSQTISEALQNVKRLRQMGLASYRIVAEEVNIEKMVEAFVTAINSVL